MRGCKAGTPRPSRCYESDENDEYQRSVREADEGGAEARPRSTQRSSSEIKDDNDLIVIAPRCFCLMSQQPNHPVLCKLLQLMVEREREVSMKLYKKGTVLYDDINQDAYVHHSYPHHRWGKNDVIVNLQPP